jgi:hypothetical protein
MLPTFGAGESRNMSTNPQEIHLSAEQRQRLVELSEKTGRSWSDLLDDALQGLTVHETAAGERLRRILDDLGRNARRVSERDLDEAMGEALHVVRHQKS